MSKHAEADLILKLYELRREETMRKARDWYFRDFNPQSASDIMGTMFSPQSGYLRMVMSYWDMAAALVNQGAISLEMFTETNGEHIGVFSKLEPFLAEMRENVGPEFMSNVEKLIDASPHGRERVAKTRERFAQIRARMAEAQSQAAGQS